MHIGNAGGLLQGYDRAETTVNNAIGGLTGPLNEAYGLLAYTPHPNAHPRVQLTDIASGLGKDQVDLAWRRDWISSHDGVDVPATLGDAIAQLGLTGSAALKAEIATLNGGDLSDVVAKALEARKAEADAERLTELNGSIDDWNGSDNDPLLDDLLRERRNIIRAYVSGDAPVPEAIAAALFKTSADEGGPVLLDDLKDLWDQIPNKDLIAVAALLMLSGNREPEEQVEERSLWGSFRHNFVDGNSVIGSLARGRLSPQAAATIAQNAPDVIDTLDNAFSEISSLNPASIEGITLLLENPEQFVDNYINFAGGVGEWAVDTGTMAGALIIAGNPGLNAAYAQQTGTNVQQEVINALKSTATLAIEDPDAFAAIAVDWEGLEDDPIRWFGTQTPDIVIEVLTAGAAGGAIGARRGANIAADAVDAIDDLPPPRIIDDIVDPIDDGGWSLPARGGSTINGRWYTEHALERMAPRTPEVLADLERRAIERARSIGIEPGTEEFAEWWQLRRPDPRNIPPMVVEAEILNPGSTSIRVVTNSNGDVVTVIPR